jgi:F0F1-type ATP synthase assembly protein I
VSEPQKPDRFFASAAKYTAIATALPGAVLAGYLIGYWLDRWLGTSWLKILFVILGIVSGFAELIRQVLRDDKSK